jgi:dienelactone hydrolase
LFLSWALPLAFPYSARSQGSGSPDSPPHALQSAGPHQVTTTRHQITLPSGRPLKFTRHRPTPNTSHPNPKALVILAHGFWRSDKNMQGWGKHLASWGLDVLTPSLLHSRPWNSDHEKNGKALVTLADHFQPQSVIYGGFSAGGLAALVAASQDPRTVAFLGLDPVDWKNIATRYLPQRQFTACALFGEPTSCNAQNNLLAPLVGRPHTRLFKITGASHCHFEDPSDLGCRAVCRTGSKQFSETESRAAIRTLATAWLLEQCGLSPASTPWQPPQGLVFRLQ